MPTFTLSSRDVVQNALADYKITKSEYSSVLEAAEPLNISNIEILLLALEDGIVLDNEIEGVNLSVWEENGITFELRRSWHMRSWLPSLPSGQILLEYDFRMIGELPVYELDIFLEQWKPKRQQFSIIINGLEGRDLQFIVDGLDTSAPHNVESNAVFSTQDNLTVPRVAIDMHYDLGTRLDSAHAVFIDKRELSRVEALIVGVPQETDFSTTIGDIFLIDLVVPAEYQNDGHSAESLMIQQMRFVDGFWWPATAFMRDLPGEMHLAAQPNTDFDIREEVSFQGMMELDYRSNTEDMDLYLEATGRSVDTKGDILMLAEDLPSTFVLETTEDWGVRVASSGDGVSRLYIKMTDTPSSPGVTIDRAEIIGQDLKSATIHFYTGPFQYPLIVLDDITSGRIVASAEATVEPSYTTGLLEGQSFNGRAVLLDAQFTGILPTASSIGVNGMVTDLSLVGSLTGDSVETRHILLVEPITTIVASGLASFGDVMIEDNIAYNEHGDMLVHEDDIESLGLMDVARLQKIESLGYTLDEDGIETYEDMQRVSKALQTIRREVSPSRVALAGIVFLLLIGVLMSGWYWALPRDAVNVETKYLQRGGHLIMSEIHNTGSRDITDVSVEVEFRSLEGELLEFMYIEVDGIGSHSSVAGDNLEMMVLGYSVWDDYTIKIELKYTNHGGNEVIETWSHSVGYWSTEWFIDKAERTTWPNS